MVKPNKSKLRQCLSALFTLAACVCLVWMSVSLSACSSDFNTGATIIAVSRDKNSGARGTFTENVFPGNSPAGVVLNSNAVIAESTAHVQALVSTIRYTISYDSFGYVTERVTAINVNGVEPTIENIKNGTYEFQRPFIITAGRTPAEMNAAEMDFLRFLSSTQARELIERSGYVTVIHDTEYYTPGNVGGTLQIWGSTSVTPLMTKLTALYNSLNTATINFQVGGSGSGDGVRIGLGEASGASYANANFGMMSRRISQAEAPNMIWSLNIAIDGIAIIVHPQNPVTNITTDQLAHIFGRRWTVDNEVYQPLDDALITTWSQLIN